MTEEKNVEETLAGSSLSNESLDSLPTDIGQEIQKGLGKTGAEDVEESEVILVAMLIDDSGSINFADNEQAVREGHNQVLEALRGAKEKYRSSILIYNRYINGKQLYPFSPLDKAKEMNKQNYCADGGTPLYDETAVILSTVATKREELEEAGIRVRTITLLVTDGCDEGSQNYSSPEDVKPVVTDLKSETSTIAAMGIDDEMTNFEKIFTRMGIPEKWILTPDATGHEIREAFRTFSESATEASKGEGDLGGFN